MEKFPDFFFFYSKFFGKLSAPSELRNQCCQRKNSMPLWSASFEIVCSVHVSDVPNITYDEIIEHRENHFKWMISSGLLSFRNYRAFIELLQRHTHGFSHCWWARMNAWKKYIWCWIQVCKIIPPRYFWAFAISLSHHVRTKQTAKKWHFSCAKI